MSCNIKAQGKICALRNFHDGCHIDQSGFKFYNDQWPDEWGNGPDGYPMNNPTFDAAAKRALENLKQDADDADQFSKEMKKDFLKEMKGK